MEIEHIKLTSDRDTDTETDTDTEVKVNKIDGNDVTNDEVTPSKRENIPNKDDIKCQTNEKILDENEIQSLFTLSLPLSLLSSSSSPSSF